MSTPELSGLWTYRSFNPTYVTGDQTTPQRELELILAEADLNLDTPTSPTTLEGAIQWPGGGLDLKATVLEGDVVGLEIVGTGRPGTDTAGWEYRYHGHLLPSTAGLLATGVYRPILGGSVIRTKPHGDSPAGSVYSFIAILKQRFRPPRDEPFLEPRFAGLWTYRSFHNNPTLVYKMAPQNAHELILQEAVFKIETPTNWWTLQGTIEWPGRLLDLNGRVGSEAGDPSTFEIRGIGRRGTDTAGWEYYYRGYLTRHWPNGVDQRPALVGSVTPAVAPFIAVKQ